MRLSFLILTICCAGLMGLAQTGQYVFTNYSTAQGLPDNNIQSLLTDSRGFLWVATAEGLSRFDGKNFKKFYAARQDSLVQGNFFNNLYEYKKGHLVMGNSARVIAFDTYAERFYPLPISAKPRCILTRSNNKWLLSGAGKLYMVNDAMQVADSIPCPIPNSNDFFTGLYLHDQELVLMIAGKCFRYNTQTKKTSPILVNFAISSATFIPYLRHYDAQEQAIYFSEYRHGLYRYWLHTGKTEKLSVAANGLPFTTSFIYTITPISSATWWLLTERGLRIWNRKSNTITIVEVEKNKPASLMGNSVYAACADGQGNYWLATNNGIRKLNANTLFITTYANQFTTSEGSGLMSVVKGADANMYASVYLGKASAINTRTQQVKDWSHAANTGNWNLFARGDEVIRTGVGNRLLAYNTRTGQYKTLDFLQPYYPNVELVVMGFVHSNGDEWYCANRGGGFVRKLAGTNTYRTYKKGEGPHRFSYGYYTSYAEDGQGNLWFGVNKTGILLHWIKQEDRFEEIDFNRVSGTKEQVFSGVNAVACDADNNIWVAYHGSGLIHYNTSKKTALRYSIADGLLSDFITGLRFDGQRRLWITTMKGLSCLIANEKKCINFKREDGLPADDFTDYCNYYDTATNQLWLGAHSVLMHFNPDELIGIGRKQFPIYIDEMYLNGKRHDLPVDGALQLRANENNLQLHFVGVDLNKGADIEYSYRLVGADADWNASGSNQTASYANLKPGAYSFKLRARYKGDNQWNETLLPLRFTIATPWNRSWWFFLLMALATAGLIWYLIKSYYARRLEKERAFLEKEKAVEQERTRIATDMHDDFGANLSRIKFLSEKIKITGNKDAGLSAELTKISNYSDEMAEKMGEIVWALNQKYDSMGELVAFCRAYASEYLEAHGIALDFTELVTDRQLKGEIRRNLFLVLKEGLHNIIKHAGATQVSILFEEENNMLHIRISDDGKGIDLDRIRPFANGLENMKKRVRDCGGGIDFVNKGGTVILIDLPLPPALL
jgi:signal transduction histidine kinase/ligand-binding sensor domain-containing protein